MGNWKELIPDEDSGYRHKSRKPDKARFCRKNRLQGGRYGYHEYDQNGKCVRCGRYNKQESFGDLINEQQ